MQNDVFFPRWEILRNNQGMGKEGRKGEGITKR
jgi:hypothetical protein